MERVLTSEQMRSADRYTTQTLGIPEETLVERAGTAIADEIIKRFRGGRVLVCVGKGNNGADGKVIAEILSAKHGFSVVLLKVFNGIFKLLDNKFDIIVDCIFGTGLNRVVEGKYKTAIEKINSSGSFVISCDIPSGLNSDTGFAMGVAVKANLTVAIQEYKLGHFLNDGPDYCGETVSRDIGISIWGDDYIKRMSDSDLSQFFKERNRNVHKGNFGKTAIIGGSKNYSGSVILSLTALAALKTGIGYSNLAIPESLYQGYIGVVPECTFTPIKDCNGNIVFDKNALDKLLKYDCVAIGMGMGVSEEIYKTVVYFLRNFTGILLIDADGLNTLAAYGISVLKEKKCRVILTPHIGEFSRLSGLNKAVIMSDVINSAKDFAREFDIILLLKSAVSVITDGDVAILNTAGCSGMAKGGSGDVLSGLVAGLAARCGYSVETVAAASYLFGKAGEIAQNGQNEFTVTATDIISSLSGAINSL